MVGEEAVGSGRSEPVLKETFCCRARTRDIRQSFGIRCFVVLTGGKQLWVKLEEKHVQNPLVARLEAAGTVEETPLY